MNRRSGRQSAADVVYDYVRERIIASDFEEGEFLTEGRIAEVLGMSRTPVREAFLRLEAEQLLSLMPKKGAFIPPITRREVEEVMETRRMIEVFCATKVQANGLALTAPLAHLLAEQQALIDSGDVEAFIDCDRRFHQTIVSAADNGVLNRIYDGLRERQLRMGVKAVVSTPSRAQQVLGEHEAIARSLDSGDAEAVRNAIERHLDATLDVLRARH